MKPRLTERSRRKSVAEFNPALLDGEDLFYKIAKRAGFNSQTSANEAMANYNLCRFTPEVVCSFEE